MATVKQNTQSKKVINKAQKNNKRPEIRDDLDSRKNEEQHFKGDGTTHNKKDTE